MFTDVLMGFSDSDDDLAPGNGCHSTDNKDLNLISTLLQKETG